MLRPRILLAVSLRLLAGPTLVYAHDLKEFERIVASHGVLRDDHMKLITEAEHFHTTSERFSGAFEKLSYRLGVGRAAEPVSW